MICDTVTHMRNLIDFKMKSTTSSQGLKSHGDESSELEYDEDQI